MDSLSWLSEWSVDVVRDVIERTTPAFFATRLVDGVPLSYESLAVANPTQVGDELALFLARLHQPDTLAHVEAHAGPMSPPHPPPQATRALDLAP